MEARGARHAPGSFFRSGNHCPALIRSTVLSRLGNSPARRSSVKRTSHFIGLSPRAPRPKPSTRLASSARILSSPRKPINLTCPFHRLLSDGGIPHPMILCPTDMTVCLASRPQRPSRVEPHGREGQRKKERVCMLPSAHVRTRMRAPARLYEKENYSKTTCCRPP